MDPIPSHSIESFGSPRWATDPPAERPRRRAANPLRRPGPRALWRPSSKKRWKDRWRFRHGRISGWWFFAVPLSKMMEWKSVGMMTFPIINTYYMEKKCSKPPTRYGGSHMLHVWYIYLHNWVILDKGKCWYIFQHHGAYGVGWLMGKNIMHSWNGISSMTYG